MPNVSHTPKVVGLAKKRLASCCVSSTGGTGVTAPADEETGFLTPFAPSGRRRATLRLTELEARLKSPFHWDEDEPA